MGFCFLNNAAIAARAARAAGAKRVLILDWDVHHGNGTQVCVRVLCVGGGGGVLNQTRQQQPLKSYNNIAPPNPQHIFEESADVLYMSLHRWDGGAFYPGTGAPNEAGWGAGRGFNVNVAWDGAGATDGDYALAMRCVLLPIVSSFDPCLVIISAGFDAAAGDPIGGCRLTPAAFALMTEQLAAAAPTTLLLEGGYNLTATAGATEACVRVLMGEAAPALETGPGFDVTLPGWRGVQSALAVQQRFWPCLVGAAAEPPPAHVVALIRQHEEAERQRQEVAAAAAARQRELMRQRELQSASPPLSSGGGSAPLQRSPWGSQQHLSQQQQQQRGSRSREATPTEERPWSSRYRRPSFSVTTEARMHMNRAGMSRKQMLRRHLARRALRQQLKRRCAAAQRRGTEATTAVTATATAAAVARQHAEVLGPPFPSLPSAAGAAGAAGVGAVVARQAAVTIAAPEHAAAAAADGRMEEAAGGC